MKSELAWLCAVGLYHNDDADNALYVMCRTLDAAPTQETFLLRTGGASQNSLLDGA